MCMTTGNYRAYCGHVHFAPQSHSVCPFFFRIYINFICSLTSPITLFRAASNCINDRMQRMWRPFPFWLRFTQQTTTSTTTTTMSLNQMILCLRNANKITQSNTIGCNVPGSGVSICTVSLAGIQLLFSVSVCINRSLPSSPTVCVTWNVPFPFFAFCASFHPDERVHELARWGARAFHRINKICSVH